MDRSALHDLLYAVAQGEVDVEAAAERLAVLAGVVMDFAHLDTHRALRTGLPEVIFGQGKSAEQIAALLRALAAASQVAIATRVDDEKAHLVRQLIPEVRDCRLSRVMVLPSPTAPLPAARGPIGVICAGTSDLPVAEEAAVVLEALGHPVRRFRDVGVSGLHRIMGRLQEIRYCTVLIVVAGMEGALASVVGGLVPRPVIAVPTSIGYGASFGGIAALLAMLNSCAPGVSVVNIDNGFGAACQAALINLQGV